MPPFNLDQYCHDGPMARTVADCALLQNVIAGRHPGDIVSLTGRVWRGEGCVGEGTVFASVVTVIKPVPAAAAPAVDERLGALTP
jgi:hypothetical protein